VDGAPNERAVLLRNDLVDRYRTSGESSAPIDTIVQ
jgi:hypothetical protein